MKHYKEFCIDKLTVKIFTDRKKMGVFAADQVSHKINELLTQKKYLNIIFAAAHSQDEFLESLSHKVGLNWDRINAFHMDEYIGLEQNHPQRFSNFLREKIFERVRFHKVYFLNTNGDDPMVSCKNYAELIRRFPPDIVCMGIGENTHVAFNDPHDADFNDPLLVKLVSLDKVSRLQQVHDGCFATLGEVPQTAITLTVPALMKAEYVFCIVPGRNKANAVYHTINSQVSERYPSTFLRRHPHATLYLDAESASELDRKKE